MADDYASIVEQAYLNEVGRPSDPEGAAYWTGLLQSGAITPADLSSLFSGTTEGMAFDQGAGTAGLAGTSMGGGEQTTGGGTQSATTMSPTVQSQMTGTTGGITSLGGGTTAGQVAPTTDPGLRSFLEGQYQSEFGRPFDAPGLDYWTDQIQKGNVTKEQVANIFSQSPEGMKYDIGNLAAGKTTDVGYISPDMLNRYTQLQSAYQTNLYRPGDVEGMKYWLSNPTDYSKAIGGSDEAFVQQTYRNTLKYAPDPEGLKYWTGQLASGAVTRANLPTALANAAKQKTLLPSQTTPSKPVVGPGGVLYSNSAQSGKAYDFGNFPLTSGTKTNADGSITPTVSLNLPSRPKVSLGIKSFAPLSLTDYSYDSASGVNLFGGKSGGSTGKSVSLFDSTSSTPAETQGNDKSEVIKAANGGMISSDPVLRRTMFRASGGPVSSVGSGITSTVTTPEENAKSLQTMFAPGFRRGGPVQHFYNGGEAKDVLQIGDRSIEGPSDVIPIETPASVEEPSASTQEPYVPKTPAGRAIRDFFYPSQKAQEKIDRAMEEKARADAVEEARRRNPVPSVFSEVTDEEREAARQRQRQAVDQASGVTSARDVASRQIEEREMYRQAYEDEAKYRGMTAPDASPSAPAKPTAEVTREPVKDRLSLRLEELKAEREANKEKRRENQLLALMQAGFAAAAGRSRNALTNIAAGGISGVQTLAELNKDVRAEDRALRREILETELTQERMREAAAERRAAREQTAAERERTMLQTVSSNINNRLGNIRSDILSARTKLTPGIPEDQKREIEIEIANLSAQARAEQDRLDQLYDRLGIGKPRTAVPDSAGFKFLGAKK